MFRVFICLSLVCLQSIALAQLQPDEAEAKRQAELAKKPQYQRLLKAEDAKKVQELDARATELENEGKRAEAAKVVEALLAFRREKQGADHWEVMDAKRLCQDLRADRTPEKVVQLRQASKLNSEGVLLKQQGKYREAEPLFKKALDNHRKILGEEHPDTAASYNNLAMNLQDRGKADEAAPNYQKALDIRRKILGEEHPDTAVSYNNLAMNLKDRGKADEAALLHQKALAIFRKILGEDHEYTAQTYNNLAMNLQAQGKADEAALLHQKALAIFRKILGEDHEYTATSYNNLAMNLQTRGKADEAAPLLQRALAIFRKIGGEEHPQTAASYNNLANNLDAQGKVSEATLLYRKALEIRRQILGEEHPDTAVSYNNLALNLQDRGMAEEAAPLFWRVLDIFRKILGEDHPRTAISYSNLARNLEARGKADEAAPLFQKALDIFRKIHGEEHPDTATSYNNLAFNMDERGKADEAAPLYQKALDIQRKIFGEEHPNTALTYNNLAKNLEDRGKVDEAAPLLQRALDIFRKILGEEHPLTATGYNNLAKNLEARGKADEAASLHRKALDIVRKIHGEDHPYTASSYGNMAINLQDRGKASEAAPLLHTALDIRRKILGEEHPETAISYAMVASNLDAQGKADAAAPLYQKALDINRRILGEEHPTTADRYKDLALNFKLRGKANEAIATLTQGIYSYEASRITRASGIERANLTEFNPRLLLAALRQARDPRQAWVDAELTLARSMLDQESISRTTLTSDDLTEEKNARSRIAAIQPHILALVAKSQRSASNEAELQSLLADRRDAEKVLANLSVVASTRLIAPAETIQAAISINAAILFWVDLTFKGGDVQEHFVCVVRSTGEPHWERLPGTVTDGRWTKDDLALPQELRSALVQSAAPRELQSLIERARSQRIAPVLKHLEGVKTLYVIGTDSMAGVPVELLAPEFTISYVPSGTFLARRGEPLDKPKTLLALGDPLFPEQKATAIPATLPPGGLLITRIVPGGPAAKALLKPNDVLVSYAGTNLESIDQLRQVLASKSGEKSVAIQIWRESEDKLATYDLATGDPGFTLAKEPARDAIAARRKADQLLASVTRGDEFAELPGSQVELSELTKLFEAGNVAVLTRSEASEPALEQLRKKGDLTKFRYLHFATHGEANNVRAFDSKLILAQDHPQQLLAAPGEPLLNNELSAREVLDHWKLDAELVTLSACETALGKSAGGDGMLGFAQAFLLAGSRSVCLSLWKVDDTATALLMDRFYRNLLGKREDGAKPMGKAAALHEAKTWLKNLKLAEATDRLGVLTDGVSRGSKKGREVIGEVPTPKDSANDSKPYSHPKYWAAFILIGDPD